MKSGACVTLSIWFLLSALCYEAAAQDLVVVRSKKEFESRGLEPNLKERISRGNVIFQFAHPRAVSRPYDPYQTVIVYPKSYSNKRDSGLTGKDESGTLYFRGYPVAPSGWISVKVQPVDSEVFVDGHSLKVDPKSGVSEKIGYIVGRHLVEARKPGLEPYSAEIDIRQANDVHIDIKLIK